MTSSKIWYLSDPSMVGLDSALSEPGTKTRSMGSRMRITTCTSLGTSSNCHMVNVFHQSYFIVHCQIWFIGLFSNISFCLGTSLWRIKLSFLFYFLCFALMLLSEDWEPFYFQTLLKSNEDQRYFYQTLSILSLPPGLISAVPVESPLAVGCVQRPVCPSQRTLSQLG